jgi:DNA relaxase NicK
MEVSEKDFETDRNKKTGTSGTRFKVRFLEILKPANCSVIDVRYDEQNQVVGFALEGTICIYFYGRQSF